MKKARARTKLTLKPETLRLLDAKKDELRHVRGALDSANGACSAVITQCPVPDPA